VDIDLSFDEPGSKQSLYFGREGPAAGFCSGDVQRLDAEAVARRDQKAEGSVIEKEGKLAAKVFVEAFAVLEIEMDYQFRVTVTRESRALSLKLAALSLEIVYLTVTHQSETTIMTVQRLGAGLQVDDGQASVTQPEMPVGF
jgi:hypothetical protein